MEVNVGVIIKKELERIERKPKWLADKIGCERGNIYNIYERSDINLTLLIRISKVIGKNLLKDFSDALDKEIADGKNES